MPHFENGQSKPFTLATALLCCIGLTLVLLTWSAWRFPESLANGGWPSAAGACAALLAYAAASSGARRTTSTDVGSALTSGATVGVIIGTFAVISHSVEVFSSLPAPIPAILGVSMWGLMFFAFGVAGTATYQKVHSLGVSVIASVWSAIVSAVLTVLYGCVIGLLFMRRMEIVLSGGLTAGSKGAVIRNIFEGASSHLLLAPLVAAAVGTTSVVACYLLRLLARRTLVILASVDILMLVIGLYAIRFASSLARSARPPFIMLGLAALCISLASAYPLGSTIQFGKRRW